MYKNKIIQMLRSRDSYVSGEQISRDLGLSRTYIWKIIKELKKEGFTIEAKTNNGYRFVSSPDSLSPHLLRQYLATKKIAKSSIEYHEEITSSSLRAYSIAEKNSDILEGTLVVAERQSKGKGRSGRSWVSPEGGIYFSIILRPDLEMYMASSISLVAALALVNFVKMEYGVDLQIKWPNDVLWKGMKLSGILAEMKTEPDKIDFMVVGVGVNANVSLKQLPEGSISLKEILGEDVNRAKFLGTYLNVFEKIYFQLLKDGFSEIKENLKKYSYIIGKNVIVEEKGKRKKVKAVDIDERGALVVLDQKGNLKTLFSGDVHLIRQKVEKSKS